MPTNTSKEYQIDKEVYYTQISIFSVFLFFTIEMNRLKDKKLSL